VASEPLESTSKAPAAEVVASACLRRAAALAGLGLELWDLSNEYQQQMHHQDSKTNLVLLKY